MYEIIFMGIPCRECDVTQEFLQTLEEIKTGNCFAITLVDYPNIDNHNEVINSIYGHSMLFDNIEFIKYNDKYIKNKINTMGGIWETNNRDTKRICNFLLEHLNYFYKREPFDKVVILSPGSPTIDTLPKVMNEVTPIRIVDIKSPIVIAAEYMSSSYVIRKFDREFLRNENPIIYPETVNIFYALSGKYNNTDNKSRITLFFEHMLLCLKPTDDIFYAYVGEDVIINKIQFSDFSKYKDYFSSNIDRLTFGVLKTVYKKEL
jgi:hypothetical protein